jgi:hypothetical protein
MWEMVHQMLLSTLRRNHPRWDESALLQEVARRMNNDAK